MLRRKQSSSNCQKDGYNQRYMEIWKQYILGAARGASGGMLLLLGGDIFQQKCSRMSTARCKLFSVV